jgi:hypothetical protein
MMLDDDSKAVAQELGRHPSLHRVCGSLHHLIVGTEAQRLLENTADLPRRGGLWIPPSWMWAYSNIHVGHKGINSDGEAVRLPVRVTWGTSPIGVLEKGEHTVSWSLAGMGHSATGLTDVEVANGVMDEFIPDNNEVPTRGIVCAHYKSDLIALLEQYVATGKEARWSLIMQLEGFVESAVETSHRLVSAEVSPNGAPVLDETSRQHIVTTLMYGEAETDSSSSMVMRLLERCLLPGTFLRVDPWRYMREAIGSAAETAIRRTIQDPHIGRKIRKVAEQIGSRDIDLVTAAYNELYPRDRLARRRTEAALNAGSDVMASWVGLPELTDRDNSR